MQGAPVAAPTAGPGVCYGAAREYFLNAQRPGQALGAPGATAVLLGQQLLGQHLGGPQEAGTGMGLAFLAHLLER
jgi:hypothetical protein